MKSSEPKLRPDGRKQVLLYLDPKLILELKRRALDEDTHLYELVEQMLSAKVLEDKAARG